MPYSIKDVKTYKVMGFHDYCCYPTSDSHESLALIAANEPGFQFHVGTLYVFKDPWSQAEHYIKREVLNPATQQAQQIRMIPMGQTILRRVTFPVR